MRFVIGGCAVLMLALSGLMLWAQGNANEGDPQFFATLLPRIESFLTQVGSGKVPGAYDQLLVGNSLLQQREKLDDLIKRTEELTARFGPYRGMERISTRMVGKDVMVATYLFKCDQYPVVWRFVFYRDVSQSLTASEKNAWRVVTVKFDTNLAELAN